VQINRVEDHRIALPWEGRGRRFCCHSLRAGQAWHQVVPILSQVKRSARPIGSKLEKSQCPLKMSSDLVAYDESFKEVAEVCILAIDFVA
jgi:hypothetical protein